MNTDSKIEIFYEDLEPNNAAIGTDVINFELCGNTQFEIDNIFNLQLQIENEKQPQKNSYKYRKLCESTNIQKNISIKSEDKKSYPTVKIKNFKKEILKEHETIKLEVSLFTDQFKLHPYLLESNSKNRLILSKEQLLKSNNDRNTYRYYYNVDMDKQECNVDGLNIIKIPEYMIKEAIELDLYKQQQRTGIDYKEPVSFIADTELKKFGDLNTSRLKFQLVLFNARSNEFIKYLTKPLFSEQIKDTISETLNKKIAQKDLNVTPLRILRCSKVIGSMEGNDLLMLFTNELHDTGNLEVEFYEMRNNKKVWEEKIKIKPTDITNKCSILLKTPKYNKKLLEDENSELQKVNTNDEKFENLIKDHPVKASFRLRRTNCNQTSDEWPFYFAKPICTITNNFYLNQLKEIHNTVKIEDGENAMEDRNLNYQNEDDNQDVAEELEQDNNVSMSENCEENKKKLQQLADRTAAALLELAKTRSIHKVLKLQRYLLNTQNKDGNTPLHLCILNGNFDLLEIIVDCALTIPHYNIINVKNNYQLTPLLLAAHIGESEVCDFLLEANSSLTEVDLNGNNCFHIACKQRNLKLVKVLCNYIKKNVDKSSVINICNYEGETPLQIAVKYNAYEIIEQLLYTAPCRLEERNKRNGMNALHYSATHNYLQVCRLMLEFVSKIDEQRLNNKLMPEFVDAQANNGCTPLHMAIANKHYLIVRLLMKYGANPFAQSLEFAHPKYEEKEELNTFKFGNPTSLDSSKENKHQNDSEEMSEDVKNSERHNSDSYCFAGKDEIMLEVLGNEQYVPKRILNKIFQFEFDRKKEKLPVQKQNLCDKLVGKKDNNQGIDFIEHFENKIRECNPGFKFNRVITVKRPATEMYAESQSSNDLDDGEGAEIKKTRKGVSELVID